jgi:hypothetical protein
LHNKERFYKSKNIQKTLIEIKIDIVAYSVNRFWAPPVLCTYQAASAGAEAC